VSDPSAAHVASCASAPQTLARRPLHHSCGLAHLLEIWTADIISAVEFDSSGNYLATGDKGGRVVLFERNDMVCSLPPVSSWPLYRRLLMPPSHHSVDFAPLDSTRKKAANTNFTLSSSRTNQSLTTSSHSRLRRRSTRFGGVNDRILHISCSQRTVRPRPISGIAHGQPLICAFCVPPRRQDD
jgi:hypothetical protein